MAKQKFNKNSLSLLLIVLKDYLKKHKVGFIFAFICILLNSVGTIMAPLMLKDITNIITENAGLGAEKIAAAKSAIGQDLIVLICSYVIALIGGFTYGQIMAVTGQTYMFELRCKVFTHMQDLPIKYFDTHDKGDIMSVYTNDIDTIRQFIIQSLPSLLICFFQFISIVVIMITSSLYLFLIVICGAIVMVFSAKHITIIKADFANCVIIVDWTFAASMETPYLIVNAKQFKFIVNKPINIDRVIFGFIGGCCINRTFLSVGGFNHIGSNKSCADTHRNNCHALAITHQAAGILFHLAGGYSKVLKRFSINNWIPHG